jgi:GNAT superfamily N-acetyltransferase
MEWVRPDGFLITDDVDRIDVALVHRWLSTESYWAAGCTFERVAKSIRDSITLGCLGPDGTQVGVTRLVTDGATFGLLTDVFVDSRYRGQGLGRFLVESALEHPEATGLGRILLATDDAHGLYRRFGFTAISNPERWMEWRPTPR